ncbi:MAG: hypothetical protein HYY14_05745 [Candidatus Omnitrophica bacterium]|nr:hypothetical protein [Candidatus Omnitrophota bacterium]
MQQTKVLKADKTRLCQGDILRDVHWVEYVAEGSGLIEVARIVFPLAIVLTQDCDLEQDHRFRTEAHSTQDKWLISVLMAPLYNVEHVYQGEHLSELGIQMERVPKTRSAGAFLRNNERPRYHYLEFEDDVPIVPSVIDFKHYFSATVKYLLELKPTACVCSVAPLFREDIAQRFAAYLARVGLPEFAAAIEETGGAA